MIRRVQNVARVLGPKSIIGISMTILGLVAGAVSVLTGQGILVASALLISLSGEMVLIGSGAEGAKLLRRVSLGYTTRIVSRLGVGLLWLAKDSSPATIAVGLVFAMAMIAIRSADVMASSALRNRRASSSIVANFGVPQPDYGPPSVVTGRELWRALPNEALVLAGIVGAFWTPLTFLASAIGIVYGLALVALLVRAAYTLGTPRLESVVDPNIQLAIDALAPRVVLYFSGNAESTYQVNMWLSTIEKIPTAVLVVLRERSVFNSLAATRVPVICVSDATDLMNLDFGTVRVSLFPVNVGKNIHFLRLPHIKSVFVGHGDSDKSASFNPYSRVYDEIWVAGPAGRARYNRAQIGVRDEAIKEVGRPQIADLARSHAHKPTGELRTLLYAPTWEGWNEEQNYCSISSVGLPLIKRILSEGLPVRVLFRPHPFTGTRLRSAADASEQIRALLEESNTKAGIACVAPAEVGPSENAVDAETALAERDRLFFEETMAGGHVTLPSAWGTAMSSCMVSADAMLTDVSSVLSDFLATDKPYACANPSAATEEEFVASFPATGGGFVISRKPSDADEFLEVLMGRAADRHSTDRSVIRQDLLGSAPEKSQERFNQAIEDLAYSADLRLESMKSLKA